MLLGIVVLIAAAVLKWGSNILTQILKINAISDYITPSTLNGAIITLLVLGVFITLVSLVGIIGVKCMSKFLLVVYFIVILILFLVHFILLIVLVFGKSQLQKAIDQGLDKMKARAIEKKSNSSAECDGFLQLSKLLSCCGADGPSDFNNTIVDGTVSCCAGNFTIGCKKESWNQINSKSTLLYLVVPSAVILFIELFAMIVTCYLFSTKKLDNEFYN